MQAINFLPRDFQDLPNHGLPLNISLLKEIDAEFSKWYKSVHRHIIHTKADSDDSGVINLPVLKCNTFTNSNQFSDLMWNVAYNLDEVTHFN